MKESWVVVGVVFVGDVERKTTRTVEIVYFRGSALRQQCWIFGEVGTEYWMGDDRGEDDVYIIAWTLKLQ